MTPPPSRSLRWYLITALLFAVPPVLGIFGIRLPAQPPDRWSNTEATVANPDQDVAAYNRGNAIPLGAFLRSNLLLRR